MRLVKDITADSIVCSNIELVPKVCEVTHLSVGTDIGYTTNQATKIPFNVNGINAILLNPDIDTLPAPLSMTSDLANNQVIINQSGVYSLGYQVTISNTLLLAPDFSPGAPEEYDVWVVFSGPNVISNSYVAENITAGSFLLTAEGLSTPDTSLTLNGSWTGYIPLDTNVAIMMYISTQNPGTETLSGLDGEGTDRSYFEIAKIV